MKYDPKKIEKKWQKFWLDKKTFEVKENPKKEKAKSSKDKRLKKMVLVEFPYPSGTGLHMGHMRPFIAGDVTSKYFTLKGFNTMYPMGWDAFGLPAENFAIKNKVHPSVSTKKNIANAKKQLLSWGTGFDWGREINTTDPSYYKWTQKLFLEFFKAGLAYEKFGEINWCPKDKTGLANEEVVDGKCERCGETVEKKNLRQWYLKITDYAEKLLGGLSELSEWPTSVKLQQENWIGRSEGSQIRFKIYDLGIKNEIGEIEVFTTRADTLFGVTYVVLAPEIAERFMNEDSRFKNEIQNKDELERYIKDCKNKSDEDRTNDKKEKTGVEIKGIKAMNPANGEEVPVWVADYVLGNYGTGAVMAVPAHDERDFEFAKKFGLSIRHVVAEQIGDIKTGQNVRSREAVRAIILKDNQILVEELQDSAFGAQIIIGGGIEKGENHKDALKREILEESGYTDVDIKEYLGTVRVGLFCKKFMGEEDVFVNFTHHIYSAHLNSLVQNASYEGNTKFVPFADYIDKVKKDPDRSRELNFILRMIDKRPFIEDGALINSGDFNNLSSEEARTKITEFVGGKIVTKYKLRDWVFSRQRYWGEPIPLVHCQKCGIVPVPEKDLPVTLPNVKKYEPTGTGESPLAAIESWVKTPCPKCIEDQKKTKYLVFDFDGVIGNTYKSGLKARVACGWANDIADAKQKCIEYFTRKPDHVRGGNYSKEELKKLFDQSIVYAKVLDKEGYKLFDAFVSEIKKIKNTRIAIISSGSVIYANKGIKKSKLKVEKVLTLEDSFSKEEKFEKLARFWKVPLSEMYYFTDANSDVYELEELLDRKKIIGCSWGYIGYDELRKALPENQILKKPKDVHTLFTPCTARRETNTMPQWAGSSWYYLRYMDPKNKTSFADMEKQKYWSPVDLYFGGMEHTTLHLLYSRFWNLVFKDRGIVAVSEPYKKRVPHGIILGPDGEKMSKSRGNVVNPDDVVALYGADTVRLYMMFLGPHGAQVAWNDKGIIGTRRFLERVFNLTEKIVVKEDEVVTKTLHKTIEKVTKDIETFSFNTAVSAMMIFVNAVYDANGLSASSLEAFLKLLAPFAPHTTEEMWAILKKKGSIFSSSWPEFDPKLTIDTEVTIAIQINGKLKGEITVDLSLSEQEIINLVKNNDKVKSATQGKEIKKAIYIKGRLVNLVVL